MNTKYPILLVHGIAIKDIWFIKSFGEIDRILRIEGFKVYKSKVDSFGTIENNARILQEEIKKIIEECKCEKVNIIAHSKGGLDSKYAIKELHMGQYVASLTTLCTPHKGSPIASSLLKLPKILLHFVAFFINFWYRIFGDKHPDSLKVCEQLSPVNSYLTETISISDKVYTQSYSTTLNKSKDDFVMGIPLAFSHHFEKKDSDGVVSNDSAKFGEYHGSAINDSVSYSEIIDFMVNKKKKDKIYSFYSSLCEDLVKKGF